jgi:hypothetical protein
MSICVVDGKHCQCGPSEGSPCPGVVELQAKLTESAEATKRLEKGNAEWRDLYRTANAQHRAAQATARVGMGWSRFGSQLPLLQKRFRKLLTR